VSVNEFSLGPVYAAQGESIQKWFWPHVAQIVEMCEPYRTGKALILPTGCFRLVAVGIWTRDIYEDVIEDFPRGGWPDWMQSWDVEPELKPKWLKGLNLNAVEEEENPGGTEES
jgi:hypothetical protein